VRENEEIALYVVEETADGIIVSGGKQLTTAAPHCHEGYVLLPLPHWAPPAYLSGRIAISVKAGDESVNRFAVASAVLASLGAKAIAKTTASAPTNQSIITLAYRSIVTRATRKFCTRSPLLLLVKVSNHIQIASRGAGHPIIKNQIRPY
jgi:hypothetical protein